MKIMQNSIQIFTARLVGIYQILGGILGFYNFLVELGSIEKIGEVFLNFILVLPFFIFSFVAGFLLLKNLSWKLTIFNHFIQIIQFKIGGVALYYTSGAYLGVGYIFSERFFFDSLSIASFVLVRINSPGGKSVIAINIAALLLFLIAIFFYEKEKLSITAEREIME